MRSPVFLSLTIREDFAISGLTCRALERSTVSSGDLPHPHVAVVCSCQQHRSTRMPLQPLRKKEIQNLLIYSGFTQKHMEDFPHFQLRFLNRFPKYSGLCALLQGDSGAPVIIPCLHETTNSQPEMSSSPVSL